MKHKLIGKDKSIKKSKKKDQKDRNKGITTVFEESGVKTSDKQRDSSRDQDAKHLKRNEPNTSSSQIGHQNQNNEQKSNVQIPINNQISTPSTPVKSDSVFTLRFHIFIPPEIQVNENYFRIGIFSESCNWETERYSELKQIKYNL